LKKLNRIHFSPVYSQKRVRFLQSQGAKEDNNLEYAQIMQFLKNLQQKQNRPPNGIPMDVTTSPSASPKANLGI
jgi:ATP-dependent helicase STH1/SNF2